MILAFHLGVGTLVVRATGLFQRGVKHTYVSLLRHVQCCVATICCAHLDQQCVLLWRMDMDSPHTRTTTIRAVTDKPVGPDGNFVDVKGKRGRWFDERGCFFFSSRRRHTRCSRDWSSDVCSSDLLTSGSSFNARQIESMVLYFRTRGQDAETVVGSDPGALDHHLSVAENFLKWALDRDRKSVV